jgi:hypothetical protein
VLEVVDIGMACLASVSDNLNSAHSKKEYLQAVH